LLLRSYKEEKTKYEIKKGDTVVVISGKDKGKQGVIQRSFPKLEKVIVDGVNLKKKTSEAYSG
jgi:large subunit ribosomal protein L24